MSPGTVLRKSIYGTFDCCFLPSIKNYLQQTSFKIQTPKLSELHYAIDEHILFDASRGFRTPPEKPKYELLLDGLDFNKSYDLSKLGVTLSLADLLLLDFWV